MNLYENSSLFEPSLTDESVTINDIKMILTEGSIELAQDVGDFFQYLDALDYVQAISERFYSFGSNIPSAVIDFVDQNKELSLCLGIDVSATIEELGAEAPKAVDEAAKKNIFRRAWDKIVAFFKMIWNKIIAAFSWVFNGFRRTSKKVAYAKKKWMEMSPADRTKFLTDQKINLTAKQFDNQITTTKEVVDLIMGILGKDAMKTILTKYLIDPNEVFPEILFEKLKLIGFSLVIGNEHQTLKAAVDSETNSVFKSNLRLVEQPLYSAEKKSFTDQGWNDAAISALFSKAEEMAKVMPNAITTINELKTGLNAISDSTLKEQILNAKRAGNSRFARFLEKIGVHSTADISNEELVIARRAMANIVSVLYSCFTASKKSWAELNAVLDAFRYTPEEMEAFQKASNN